MNTSFTLKNVEVQVSDEVSFKIGEISTSVTDYNLLEGLQVAKELPSILNQLKDVIVAGIKDVQAIEAGESEPEEEEKPLRDINSFNRAELVSQVTETAVNEAYNRSHIGFRNL